VTGGRPLGVLQPGDPEEIGQYLVRARVGAGGMGVVYLAEAPNGRPIAVKVIQAALAHDQVFRDRFRREVAAARRVRSRVTVAVLDADADSENPWVAFEYVEGPNLQDVVDAGTPRLSASIGILTGIAEALVAIHQVGIIHRDLKPSNVLCPPDGVKVIDFGIAAALEATTTTRTGLMGTPAWLSPEQITGQSLTTAVDVFAWGCIGLYTTTGRLAFASGGEDSPPALIYRVVNAEPDLSDVPDELIEPISAALT
jgi:serine/threonine protein kinase